MTAKLTGGLTFVLDDGPVRTEYSRGWDGKPTARLVLGDGPDNIAIAVSDSPAETLAQLQEAVSELRAWVTLQERMKHLPEVA